MQGSELCQPVRLDLYDDSGSTLVLVVGTFAKLLDLCFCVEEIKLLL